MDCPIGQICRDRRFDHEHVRECVALSRGQKNRLIVRPINRVHRTKGILSLRATSV